MNEIPPSLSPAELAAKCINQTDKPIFLTGKAGTGKTTFLRHIIEHTHKNTIIVAPTGIAAINAGGVTIHSQFQLPFGLYVPDSNAKTDNYQVKINTPYSVIKAMQMSDRKRAMLREVELLIIDEVSMLRADLLDGIDAVLKHVRRQNYKPFGGVQVLFIGDLMQLPPVVKEEEWGVLKQYYNSIYFFDAHALKDNIPVYIELDKIYRQSDNRFIDLLNNLRTNNVTQQNIDLLNTYYKPNFDIASSLNTITLTTHNKTADTLNRTALETLNNKSYFYKAVVVGDFNEYAYPVEQTLELKVGAQIMFIKNDSSGKGQFFNGKIGVISKLTDKAIEVNFNDVTQPFTIETHQWENIKYELNPITNTIEEQVIGTFTHYPIKLAWAITVHKSQGLTFEKAILDINRAFAPGQVYVALSRLKSLDGLVLTSPIQFNAISQDKVLLDYSGTQLAKENVNSIIEHETHQFLKNYVIKAYDFNWLYTCLKNHQDSYNLSESKSNKQKHRAWAVGLFNKFEPLNTNSQKFAYQLIQIFDAKASNYLETVHTRNQAAKNYFYPVLKELSKTILMHLESLKAEKQMKTYFEELLELEGLLFKQMQQLDKIAVVVESILNNTAFDKKGLKQNANQQERIELVRNSVDIKNTATKEAKPKRSSKKVSDTKEVKEPKPDTKEASFTLYKAGKTLKEIAVDRSMTLGTIEGHLAHYVSLGMIPVTQFLAKEKQEAIKEITKNDPEITLGQLKQTLGDDYSYSDIRFALASLKYIQ